MIVTVCGMPGSGKSTLAKLLSSKLGYKHYSTGDFWRQIAKDKGLSPLELNKLAEKTNEIDFEIDNMTKKLSETEDNFVMDSRMAWHFIPKSAKILIKIDLQVAAERIFKDKREEKENTNISETKKTLEKRMNSEKKRYLQLYGVNYVDEKNFDLVLDSTKDNPQVLLEKTLLFLKQKHQA
jgi:cytidylate kinase